MDRKPIASYRLTGAGANGSNTAGSSRSQSPRNLWSDET